MPREALTKKVQEQLLIEANFSCSIPSCRETKALDVCHINGDPDDERLANLIILCPHHRHLADAGMLDSDALRAVKGVLAKARLSPEQREELIPELWNRVRTETDPNEKGRALEDMVAHIFQSIPGFVVEQRVRTATEELDIFVRNESADDFWRRLGPYFVIECKNWSSGNIGKNEIVLLTHKIENRFGKAALGFLVSTTDYAPTARTEVVRGSRTDTLIVMIGPDDLQNLVDWKARELLLKKLVSQAAAL